MLESSSNNIHAVLVGSVTTNLNGRTKLVQAENNIMGMLTFLINTYSVPLNNISLILDDHNHTILTKVEDALSKQGEALLFYYSGHGLPDQDSLYITTPASSDTHFGSTSVNFSEVFNLIAKSNFHRKYIILDCCFSERGFKQNNTGIKGVMYGMSSTGMGSKSKATHPNNNNTLFTGELLRIIEEGIDCDADKLSFIELYNALRNSEQIQGSGSEPKLHIKDGVDRPFVVNNRHTKSESYHNTCKAEVIEPKLQESKKYLFDSLEILFNEFIAIAINKTHSNTEAKVKELNKNLKSYASYYDLIHSINDQLQYPYIRRHYNKIMIDLTNLSERLVKFDARWQAYTEDCYQLDELKSGQIYYATVETDEQWIADLTGDEFEQLVSKLIEAKERGVEIYRLYLMHKESTVEDPQVIGHLNKLIHNKIKVKILPNYDNKLEDFVIFNNELLSTSVKGGNYQAYSSTFTRKSADVGKYITLWNKLWSSKYARTWPV